jgi:hypothetical protein
MHAGPSTNAALLGEPAAQCADDDHELQHATVERCARRPRRMADRILFLIHGRRSRADRSTAKWACAYLRVPHCTAHCAVAWRVRGVTAQLLRSLPPPHAAQRRSVARRALPVGCPTVALWQPPAERSKLQRWSHRARDYRRKKPN